jgi:nucleoside-diphosphate kinase
MERYTLFMIKPNATEKNKIGEILAMVEKEGFVIVDMKMLYMDRAFAEYFYEEHKGKSFFERLVNFMSSGRTVACVLKREQGVSYLRKVVGATDPNEAEEGTIRKLFADDVTRNAVHASDSVEHAIQEIKKIFKDFDFKK